MRLKVATLALLLAATPAFAQTLSAEDQAINLNATLGETTEAPTAWLGATPHFVMVGAFGDYSFNVNLPALEGTATMPARCSSSTSKSPSMRS